MYQYIHKMLPDLFQDYFSDSTSNHSYTKRHASKNSLFIPRYTSLPQELNNLSNTLVQKSGMIYLRPSDNILILNSNRLVNFFY